jgi:hypothetical protein
MPSDFVNRSIVGAARHVPGLRRVPMLKLLAMAEIGMLAHDHFRRLDQQDRRRLIALVRLGHGRPSNLNPAQREELRVLVAKLEPRLLAGEAANRLSPFPLPGRVVRGPRRKRP